MNNKIKIGFVYHHTQIQLANQPFSFTRARKNFHAAKGLISGYYHRNKNNVQASSRIRVHDIIDAFDKDKMFEVELFKPWKKYDIVIFQKTFSPEARQLAEKLKKRNAKIVLDVNVNFYDKTYMTEKEMHQYYEINEFTKISDAIVTASRYINNYVTNLCPDKKIVCIEEPIENKFFKTKKTIPDFPLSPVRLLYSGYSVKAPEIYLIKKQIEKLAAKKDVEYIFISDRNPNLNLKNVRTRFVKYDQANIHNLMLEGDIFLAPRNLRHSYNLGHTFTKIGYPMAVGIPVIASPVPSYQNSPAVLLKSLGEEWLAEIDKLINDRNYYIKKSQSGIDYCQNNYKIEKIKKDYHSFFEQIFND